MDNLIYYLDEFFFGIYPYVCASVFILGTAMRYDSSQFSWRAGSSQLLRKKGMMWGNNLFHVGILLLFVGHLVGLLTPHDIYVRFMTTGTKQLLAVVAGGIFGTMCFIGMTILIYRRLFDDRIRATSTKGDIFILLLLYAQLILGLITIPFSLQHPNGETMVALASWAQYVVTFQSGAALFVAGQSIVFKLHIILGMTIFLVFPFTRLVHAASGMVAPFRYLLRSGYQIVRRRG